MVKEGDQVTTGTGISGKVILTEFNDVTVLVEYNNGTVQPYPQVFEQEELTKIA